MEMDGPFCTGLFLCCFKVLACAGRAAVAAGRWRNRKTAAAFHIPVGTPNSNPLILILRIEKAVDLQRSNRFVSGYGIVTLSRLHIVNFSFHFSL